MGVERTAAMLQGKKNVFEVEMFTPIIDRINENSKKPNTKPKFYQNLLIVKITKIFKSI